ncbi:MAG: hypothetical protein LBE12_04765 [Planctomycetaceae bacterium]|jgi:hypothetical protein|nr:hypothetical protein [Planctomycetaceae bacterium]
MKIYSISNMILSVIVCFSLQIIPVLADSSQWSKSDGGVTTSRNLHWTNPKTAIKPISGVITMDQPIAVNYQYHQASGIQQVQYQQPNPATPLTPAQQDLIYPEKRPQSKTPPSGATLTPLAPSNSFNSYSRPQETTTNSTTQQQKKNSSNSSDNSSNVSENFSTRKSSTVSVPTPKLPKPAELKNPNIRAETTIQSGTVPAPTPNDTLISNSGRGIVCPDKAGFKSIREISIDIRPMPGELPKECPLPTIPYNGRHFTQTCYQWKASSVCTKAAYFEDVQLERYGHTICPFLQPVISGAKFFLTVPLLPYKMGITPPNECVYTLGHYRVGNCAPYMLDPLPISVRAILFESAAVGGAVALIP